MGSAEARLQPSTHANIAHHLPRVAAAQPFAPAVIASSGRAWDGQTRYVHRTYRQLDEDSDCIARGLAEIGVGKGTRVVLMVTPSLDLFSLVFGLFKAGAVPVMVDPGMGRASLAECIARAQPQAFIGVPLAHAARVALGWGRATLRTLVTVGPRRISPFDGFTLEQVRSRGQRAGGPAQAEVLGSDMAAILFTSGSTGVPKGAVYLHSTFAAQVESIRQMYDIRPGEVDLPTFPLFALFDPALGMVTVVPDMDASKPAAVHPPNIVRAIEDFGVTNMFGSPALLDAVARWGNERGVTLPSLQRVISAGAPVAPRILAAFSRMAPNARIATPYGATESLPVASIDASEVLGSTGAETLRGRGLCVGRPVPSAEVKIIAIDDEPIAAWSDARVLPTGEIGEIVVRGEQVSTRYYEQPDATALAKIPDPSAPGGVRHRMGDVGFVDERGRLWFCGRKAHRVQIGERDERRTLFTIPTEGPFTAIEAVKRAALVGPRVAGRRVAAMCIEPFSWPLSEAERDQLVVALRRVRDASAALSPIEFFLLRERFPVDVRHNAKIRREDLTPWAQEELAAGRGLPA